MNEQKKVLTLLQVTVPADTTVTVSAQMQVLELLGIVSNTDLVKAMQLILNLVPATTPATLKGLLHLLGSLMKMNPKSNKNHHNTINETLTALSAVPDSTLTFGTFLPICETFLTHKEIHHK